MTGETQEGQTRGREHHRGGGQHLRESLPGPVSDREAPEGGGERGTFPGPDVGKVEREVSLYPRPASKARAPPFTGDGGGESLAPRVPNSSIPEPPALTDSNLNL